MFEGGTEFIGDTGRCRLTIYSWSSLGRAYAHATAFLPMPHKLRWEERSERRAVKEDDGHATRDMVLLSLFHMGSISILLNTSKFKIQATTHKSRSFPVTWFTRATGAGPIPSTVAVSCETSVIPL